MRAALGSSNSRSTLMTGMPASIALSATGVIAAPSNGSSTMASTLSLMKVSTWLICRLTSLVPSATCRSMSGYSSARSRTLLVMAAIQPWSAAGAEKPMVTVSPSSSLLPSAAAGAASRRSSCRRRRRPRRCRCRRTGPGRRPRRPRGRGSGGSAAVGWWCAVAWDVLLVRLWVRVRSAVRCRRAGWVVRCGRAWVVRGPSRWGRSGLGRGRASGQALLEQHGDDDDHALGDGLGRAVLVVEDEDVAEGAEDEHADDGADDGAATAGEQRAADDDRGDGVELVRACRGSSCRSWCGR